MNHILLFTGITLLFVAAFCIVYSKVNGLGMPWKWLALLCLVHGLSVITHHSFLQIIEGILLISVVVSFKWTAKETLRKSEEKYRELVGLLPQVIFEIDLQGNITFSNLNGFTVFGYTEEDMKQGLNAISLIAEDDRELAKENISRVAQGEDIIGMEYTAIRKDGSTFPITIHSSKIIQDGKVIGLRGIIIDITERKRIEEALRESAQNYRAIFDAVNDAIYVHDLETGEILDVNSRMCDMTGYAIDEARNLDVESISAGKPPYSKNEAIQWIKRAAEGEPQLFEWLGKHKSGNLFWEEVNLKRAVIGGKECLLAVVRDISERKRAEENLRMQISAINAASDEIIITDREGKVEFVNPAFEKEMGYTLAEVAGKFPPFLDAAVQDKRKYVEIWTRIRSGETWSGEIISRRKDGDLCTEDVTITPVKNEIGEIEHIIAIKRNITIKKLYEEQLDRLAHHDTLTGLPNRLLFSDRLTQKLLESRRNEQQLAVMFLDLDRFKLINDTLGHNAGDLLLKQVAKRLQSTVRDSDIVARMGGDEFTIILDDITHVDEVTAVSCRVLDAMSKPFVLDGHEFFLTVSIGISMYPSDGNDVETLVRNADTAMYRAKDRGRNTYQYYTESLNTEAVERMTLESSLRKALERDEFLVYYQPRVDINTGDILGTEALIRWQHPDLGLVLPGQFIPLAEETGLIVPISEWVLRTACAQNKAWRDAGFPIGVGVNISARQFQLSDLAGTIKRVLEETGLDPKLLDIELTESTLMFNPDHAVYVLSELRDMGVNIYLDDFGTGYSSLSHLKRFPINTVKIDQSFVRDITTDSDDAAIAGAVVAMAHSLKLRVVAEGVETLEQLEFLQSLDCDEMQGYFISRPVRHEEITQSLKTSRLLKDSNARYVA